MFTRDAYHWLTTFKAEFCSAAVMFFNNLEEAQQ
jgi:hypothetical protein